MVPIVTNGKIGGGDVPSLNPVRAVSSLVPEPGPRRPYALATLINYFGSGLLLVSMPLYFTRIVHLSAGQVGIGLSIAGAVTLLASLPIGDLADRRGPLEVAKATLLLQFGTTLAFLFIRDFASFAAVATADALAARAYISANGPLLRRLAGENAASFRASAHAIQNLGFTLGIASCGIAIQIGTPAAYHVMISIDALSFLVAWVVLRRVPHYDPLPKPATASRWGALRDRPFVAYTALTAAFVLQFSVITLLLPLWVVDDTHAPRWCIPMTLVINTILVVLLQVRVGGRVNTIPQGGVAWRRAGVIFLLSCSAMGLAAGLPGWAALLLLVAGVSLHTVGELWHMAAAFALTFGLPPAHAQGQYSGLVGIGGGIGAAIAPALLLGLVLPHGRPGMIGLGAFFALTGLLMPAVARWGERTRPASPGPGDLEGAAVVSEATDSV
jgi:MFS family permease